MDKINIDFVICKICKKSFLQITSKHLKKHNLTVSQYKQLYPNAYIRCKKSKEKHLQSQIATNQLRYNVDRPLQNKLIKQKADNTLWENYHVTNAFLLDKARINSQLTCLQKYGGKTPLESNLYNKIQQSAQTEESKIKRCLSYERTCLQKYNVKHTSQLISVQEKIKQTCLQRYNVVNGFLINDSWKLGLMHLTTLPNKVELQLLELVKPFAWYCGNGQYWVTFLNKKHKNPDFKIHNKLVVIELFGTHWHTMQEANYIIQQYELINYKCLIIWDTELQNTNLVIKKIMSFLSII